MEKYSGQVLGAEIDLPVVSSSGHYWEWLTFTLFFFCLSFFFQGVLWFFLCIWLLLVFFFAHAVLLDKTYFYCTDSSRIVNCTHSRMRFLVKRLNELIVVDRTPGDTSKVFFGAWVELEDPNGNLFRYRIVGPDEFDLKRGFISIDSPMAKALLRKTEGDEVVVNRPHGTDAFVVTSVGYEVQK